MMMGRIDQTMQVSQEEAQSPAVVDNSSHPNRQFVLSQRKLPRRSKPIIAAGIILAFLFCYLYFQYEKGKLEGQIVHLKRDYESHSQEERQAKEVDKLKFSFLREYESEKFYNTKVQNIKDVLKHDNFLKDKPNARTSFLLAMNNYKLPHQNVFLSQQINKLLKQEYNRLSKKYDFSLPQEPFCIVVPTINNVQNFRYEYNLRSIFNQNYTNYKVVIIDDASTDQNFEVIQQYLKDNPVKQEVILVKNKERGTAVPNIYKAATQYCKPEDILALVDGDDELLGVNIFKVFNSLYVTNKLEVLYSNYITFKGYSSVSPGISQPYTDEEKRQNLYRKYYYTRMFPVRSFRVRNFLKILKSDLQSEEGAWFKSAYDHAICTPLLELSCGKNEYVEQYFYLYNTAIGSNDLDVDASMNVFVANEVRYNKKAYHCES